MKLNLSTNKITPSNVPNWSASSEEYVSRIRGINNNAKGNIMPSVSKICVTCCKHLSEIVRTQKPSYPNPYPDPWLFTLTQTLVSTQMQSPTVTPIPNSNPTP